MLKEISGPYYIVCGYTDLRRGIDGLAGIVQQNFKLDVCSGAVFLFVTVFCCFTSVLTMADFSGQETKQRQNRSHPSNTHG